MKKQEKFVILLTAEDVYRLLRLVEDHRFRVYGDGHYDRLYRCLSKAYKACLDDIPVSLLYPGLISQLLEELNIDGVVSGDDIS